MITYAGVDVSNPAEGGDLAGLLDRYWHRRRLDEADHPAYLTHGIDHLPIPYPPRREAPRPGVLVWPTGASRWATFHQFVTGDQLAAVRTATGLTTFGTLKIDDGTASVSAGMYLLPARPACQKGDKELYLLALVDERYFWWLHGAEKAPDAPASWTALLTALFTSLSITPTLPSIPAAYGTPDPARWAVGYKPIPLLIDAACATVGLRVVRGFDGTVSVVTASAANAADLANWTANRYECLTGGRLDAGDVGRNVPASVAVVFPGDAPAVSTVTLAGLALTEYAGPPVLSGLSNTAAQVNADLPATASASARTNYANQAAADYYLWALTQTDATFRGVVNWTPTGQEDRVEVDHSTADVLTRVLRGPYSDLNVYGDRRSSGDSSFLAQLVGKCYPATAGAGSVPADADCAADGGCGSRFLQYSWVRVKDSGASPGPPCPLVYDYDGSPVAGGPGCSPAYHVRNLDLPVWQGGVAHPVCGAGSATPSGTVQPLSVVRLRKGAGDYYLFGEHPYEDLVRRTGVTDADGEKSFLEYYDQHDATFKDGREYRLIYPP